MRTNTQQKTEKPIHPITAQRNVLSAQKLLRGTATHNLIVLVLVIIGAKQNMRKKKDIRATIKTNLTLDLTNIRFSIARTFLNQLFEQMNSQLGPVRPTYDPSGHSIASAVQ